MARLRIPNNWEPRAYQRPLWGYLEGGGTRAIEIAHRRWGKDDVALHWAASSAMQRVGNYWHMLPEASQARKAIWNAVNPHTGQRRINEAFPQEIRRRTQEQEMFIEFVNGSTWQVTGSDNYDSLVGSAPVGVVFSEWALADPMSWAYIRPILLENSGWAVFISTPRGRNHLATFYEGARDDDTWYTEKSTADATGVFSPEQLEQERKEYIREYGVDDGEARFRQEYLCDFNVSVVGSYYGHQLTDAEDEGRITNVPHDPSVVVDTWWDLGFNDRTSVWFVQRLAGVFHVIDFYEADGEPLAHYAAMLTEKREQHKYLYGRHIWPHDGSHKTLASAGQPLSSMFYDLGFPVEVQRQSDILQGIQRVRQILPLCYFDREKCAAGINALREYRKAWDEKNRIYSNRPVHDWASHAADAFRQGAVAHYDRAGPATGRDRDYRGSSTRRRSGWAA